MIAYILFFGNITNLFEREKMFDVMVFVVFSSICLILIGYIGITNLGKKEFVIFIVFLMFAIFFITLSHKSAYEMNIRKLVAVKDLPAEILESQGYLKTRSNGDIVILEDGTAGVYFTKILKGEHKLLSPGSCVKKGELVTGWQLVSYDHKESSEPNEPKN